MKEKQMIIEKYLNGKIKIEQENIEYFHGIISNVMEQMHNSEKALETLYLEMQRVCTHPNEKNVLGYVYCDQCHMVLSEPGA